jgi:peptidyl-prolyl cis-trans isomerase D
MFENEVRNDLSRRQVMAGVAGTGFAAPAQADVSLNAFLESVKSRWRASRLPSLRREGQSTDAEIESFYKDNPALFQAPEQANVEYLVLDLDTRMLKGITINEAT